PSRRLSASPPASRFRAWRTVPGRVALGAERRHVGVPPMIRFACPNCNAVMTAPDNLAGSKGVCPKCGQKVKVPNPPPPAENKTVLGKLLPEDFAHPETATNAATAPTPPPSDRIPMLELATAVPPAPVASPTPQVLCPHCHRLVATSPQLAGQVVLCPHCRG